MRVKLKSILLGLIVVSMFLCFGCSGRDAANDKKTIVFKDVIYSILSQESEQLIPVKGTYKSIIKTNDEVMKMLDILKPVEDISGIYDDDYFSNYDLVVIAFESNSDYRYSVKDIELSDNKLNVMYDERVPEVCPDLSVYQGIFIQIEKDSIPKDAGIVVKFNEIKEGN